MSFDTALRALIDSYLGCYAAKDASGCAQLYHPQGRIASPFGPPVIGRATIAASHEEWFQEGEENKQMRILSSASEGALAYALIRYTADLPCPDGGAPAQEAGTSLNVFTHEERWMFLHTSLNTDFEDQNG